MSEPAIDTWEKNHWLYTVNWYFDH